MAENKQIIVAIGREFGSGGHDVAEKIAAHYGITMYDKNVIVAVARELGVSCEEFEEYDETPRPFGISRRVRGMTNSFADNLAQLEFEYLKDHAEEGESFVIVGHCAAELLQNYNIVSIFVHGSTENKLERIMKRYNLDEASAEKKRRRVDARRKRYHNTHSRGEWGHIKSYDLCIESDGLSTEEIAEVLIAYIDRKVGR